MQKNGGKNTARNGVTLCKVCHYDYHRAKKVIMFADVAYLPAHIRGHTFKLEKSDKIDWKRKVADGKKLRNSLEQYCGIKLTLRQIAILMRFLFLEFDSDDD